MRGGGAACLLFAVAATGCKKPPPAPEGLDESARYVLREFYSSDDIVGAGLTGFMNWFDEEGYELVGESADSDNVGSFTLGDLSWDDVGHLPLVDDGRSPDDAAGVVSVAFMGCDWTQIEALYVREDQMAVFEGDYEAYNRTYTSSRVAFEDARRSMEIAPVEETAEVFTKGLGDLASAFLLTDNTVTQSTAGITITADMMLHLRHGIFEVQGEDTEASIVFAFTPERAEGDNGANSLEQSYSVVINIDRGDGETLRVFALWTELDTILVGSDSALVLSAAVNKSQEAADRLSAICAGEIALPAE